MSNEKNDFPEVTTEGKSKQIIAEVTVPFPEDFVYSNASALATSLMDVHISFAEVMPEGGVRAKIGVVMPVDHAALFALNLIEQLGRFEHSFGAIRHPAWKAFRDKAPSVREEIGNTTPDDSPDGQTVKKP